MSAEIDSRTQPRNPLKRFRQGIKSTPKLLHCVRFANMPGISGFYSFLTHRLPLGKIKPDRVCSARLSPPGTVQKT